jgi:hypothetical protein
MGINPVKKPHRNSKAFEMIKQNKGTCVTIKPPQGLVAYIWDKMCAKSRLCRGKD